MKDSHGNPLPEPIILKNNSTKEEVINTLNKNLFLTIVGAHISKGDIVEYDATTKSAMIMNFDGTVGYIEY